MPDFYYLCIKNHNVSHCNENKGEQGSSRDLPQESTKIDQSTKQSRFIYKEVYSQKGERLQMSWLKIKTFLFNYQTHLSGTKEISTYNLGQNMSEENIQSNQLITFPGLYTSIRMICDFKYSRYFLHGQSTSEIEIPIL